MTSRLPVIALPLALAVAALQPGCTTTAPRPPPAVAAAATVFQSALTNVRTEGREEIDDILGVYANLPADQAPGVAALRRDIAEALARLKREGRERLEVDEVDRLTVQNPNFWHAWFEFDPRDSSLLMLHASLLMEAGEVFRASMVLTVGAQALPLNVQERVFWFTQQARTHWTAFRRLDELREREKAWGGVRRAREAGLARIVRDWPADGFALEVLLQSRAGFKPGSVSPEDNAPVMLTPGQRQRVAKELAHLGRINPVAAARYAEDRAAALEFGRLWTRLVDEDRAVESRELVQFAARARELGLGELAMIAGRAVAAQRGFTAPADLEFVRGCLPLLLPPTEADRLFARIEDGRLPLFRLTRPPEQPNEVLDGMDPAIHPLLADHAVREYARESLWIQTVGDNEELRAQHLRLRAIGSSNAGRVAAALADLDEALALRPRITAWQIDRAVLLSKLGRTAEADAAFARLKATHPDDDYLRNTLAVHQFAEGRFAEAEALFRAVKPDNGNFAYEVIFGYLAGLRRGAPDRGWLQQHRSLETAWPAPIQRYLLGELDRTALLQAARDSFDLRTTEQQCEAYFALGEVALAAGDRETARRELENCVQSGIVGFIEYGLARRDLERLAPPKPAEPRLPESNTPARPAEPGRAAGPGDDGSPA